MSITVVSAAATTLLTTLDRVRAELGLTETTDDAMLSDMLERASSAIARECRRSFGRQTVAETVDGSGSRLLGLSIVPLVSITSVTEDTATLAASEYSIEDAESGALYRLAGWGRSTGLRMWGIEAYASGYILPGYQDRRYTVTYVGGYVLPPEATPNLPGAVEQAAIVTVSTWYLARQAQVASPAGLKRITTGSLTMEWDINATSATQDVLPPAALGLLRNYYQTPLR